jgi:hypothetical protein
VANAFGLFREYQHRPSYDPDSTVPSDDLAYVVTPGTNTNNSIDTIPDTTSEAASSSTNVTTELLLNWQNSGSELKSHSEVNRDCHGFCRGFLWGMGMGRDFCTLEKPIPTPWVDGF